jgi:two-component system cell cycle sensor histidine kinase/response regulator CckA
VAGAVEDTSRDGGRASPLSAVPAQTRGERRAIVPIGAVLPAIAVVAAGGAALAALSSASPALRIGLAATFAVLAALALVASWIARRTELTHDRTEAALVEERFLLELLLSHSLDLIYFKDRESRFIRVSESVARRFEVPVEEIIGKTDFDFFTDEHAGAARAQELQLMESGQPLIGVEERETWLDGERHDTWVETIKVPLRAADGTIVGLAGVNRDITDRKRGERERALLETQRIESLGLLAGGVAHDFNNLLMGVLGNAGIALSEIAPSSPAHATVERIMVAAKRAADLANALLAFSGKAKYVLQPIDLSHIVAETVELLQTVISKDAELRVADLPAELPSLDGDETQIRQVVMNLITNASEALGDAPGVITVSTGAVDLPRSELAGFQFAEELPEGRYVFLEVTDSGAGMSPETQRQMFDPFFTTKFTGRGLGLASLLGIVRAHRGAIRVASAPGEGTALRVIFPAAPGVPQEPVEREAGPAQLTSTGTILVADDEEIVRAVTTRMLEQAGFTVVPASDGIEALALFRERQDEIAAVLLDVTMPGKDGNAVFAELRKLRADVPVILTSGYDEQEIARALEGDETAVFIHKPYVGAELLAKLNDVLARRPAVHTR